jgi:Ca2+-binding EF-hand superfamily protein
MKFKGILFGIGLALSASLGMAQQRLDTATTPAEFLRQIDTDRDGFITKEEWNRFFVDHDENKDGMLSREDAGVAENTGRATNLDPAVDGVFDRLDGDKDGVIARAEWHGTERALRLIDADGNGVLSREEFRSPNARSWNVTFKDIDVNQDGMITRNEWLDTEEAFKRLDRDRNGTVTEREFYSW